MSQDKNQPETKDVSDDDEALAKFQPKAIIKNRKVGRWYLGETLGKGGYSWVKKGYDRKDGRVVALKFTSKSKENWSESQSKQIQNEIESLRQIKHKHVLQLLAYNLNAKYPQKDGAKISAVLLVLEYLPGGELFDILYYTQALSEDIARTYFVQLMNGLEACHEAGICHRDIKPQNLLLDSHFQLKIADFGLAKVFEHESEALMSTFYVGTRGYQAPEILNKQEYTVACDIFSCGVVLFILMSGYPPFESASTKCKWYAPLAFGNAREFWKGHRGCGIPGKAKDLITRMLWYDAKKRIDIQRIRKHKWILQQKVLSGVELGKELKQLHRLMEIKRKQDPEKIKNLEHSIIKRGIGKNCRIFDSVKQIDDDHKLSKEQLVQDKCVDYHNGDIISKVAEVLKVELVSDVLGKNVDCTGWFIKLFFDGEKKEVNCSDVCKKIVEQLGHKHKGIAELGSQSSQSDDLYMSLLYAENYCGCSPEEFPEDETVTIKDVFTTEQPRLVLEYLQLLVMDFGGEASIDFKQATMEATLAAHNFPTPVTISMRIFRYQKFECFLVKFERIGGCSLHFARVLRKLVGNSKRVLTGLPDEHFKPTAEEQDKVKQLDKLEVS